MFKKFMGAAAIACSVGFMAAPAHAEFVLHNVKIDLNGVAGLDDTSAPGTFTYSEVDALTFLATVHAVTNDTNGDFLPTAGETGEVSGFGIISGFSNDGGIRPSDSGLNFLNSTATVGTLDGFEFTFEFVEVPIRYTSNAGDFVHTAPSAGSVGILTMYIDNLGGGGTVCNSETATAPTNCTDGTLIASWVITPGDGGAFTFATFDGSDDATFQSTFLLGGVWFDDLGNDLGCDSTDGDLTNDCTQILGLADSNFDADPDGTGGFGGFSPASFNCGSSPVDFCASEDGSFVLARVPEPTTLGLLGIGVTGLGFLSLRRRKQQ